MPAADPPGGAFVDTRGRIVCHDGAPIRPDRLTGLAEQHLAVHAAWALTQFGQRVASELRVHKGNRGDWHSFVPIIFVGDDARPEPQVPLGVRVTLAITSARGAGPPLR
jgi:hypothetical protein